MLNESNRQLEHEVRERHKAEAEARHQAHHDPLTGLPNRLLFLDRIASAFERARRHSTRFALLYVDIDGFKPVNDVHGHAAGDVLLQQIARRLGEGLRRSDTVARLGGDEFAVLLDEVHGGDDAMHLGKAICQRLAQPFALELPAGPIEVRVGASVGAAVQPDHASTLDALLDAADSAMYRAKRTGRNQCLLATPAAAP